MELFEPIDRLVLGAGAGDFIFFLLIHIITFRYLKTASGPRLMMGSFLGGTVIGIPFFFWLGSNLNLFSHPVSIRLTALLLSGFIYGLLVFHYIAWIFGMGEAAIRIRLLFELDQQPNKRATLAQICHRYNASQVLEVRIARLVNAGHLSFDGHSYQIRSQILLFQAWITKALKFLMGIPAEH